MIPYMVGKLAPNSNYFSRGLVKYVPERAIFVSSPPKTGTNLGHARPPQSLNSSLMATSLAGREHFPSQGEASGQTGQKP